MSNDVFSTSMRQSIQRKVDTFIESIHEEWLTIDDSDRTMGTRYSSTDGYVFRMSASISPKKVTLDYVLNQSGDSVADGYFVFKPTQAGKIFLEDETSSHYITKYSSGQDGSVNYSSRSVYSELAEGGPQRRNEKTWDSKQLKTASVVKSLNDFHESLALRIMSGAGWFNWVRPASPEIEAFIDDPIGQLDFLRTLESKAFNVGQGRDTKYIKFTLPDTFPTWVLSDTNLDIEFYHKYLQPLLQSGEFGDMSKREFVDMFASRYFESVVDDMYDEIIKYGSEHHDAVLWNYAYYGLGLPQDMKGTFYKAAERALLHHFKSLMNLDVLWDDFFEKCVRKGWKLDGGPVRMNPFGVKYL